VPPARERSSRAALGGERVDAVGDAHELAAARVGMLVEDGPDLAVVANASDPHVAWAASAARTVTWVALGAPWRGDAATCPSCAALLDWGEPGDGGVGAGGSSDDRFECRTCGFAQPETKTILVDDEVLVDGARIPLHLAVPGAWNRMNAALALTAAVRHFGVDPRQAVAGMESVGVISGRFSTRTLPDGRTATVLLAKNPSGWTEVLRWLGTSDRSVVLAVNAHVADGRDPSWLWDVPYEMLRGQPVAASGERALDVAVRLDYGDVDHLIEPDPLAAAARLPGDDVTIIASYTQFTHLTRGSW
jgi:UDP-N-acetylmuramyl tripeptide synthase